MRTLTRFNIAAPPPARQDIRAHGPDAATRAARRGPNADVIAADLYRPADFPDHPIALGFSVAIPATRRTDGAGPDPVSTDPSAPAALDQVKSFPGAANRIARATNPISIEAPSVHDTDGSPIPQNSNRSLNLGA